MKLAEATWQDVEGADRASVVVIPTGSIEQHGPHLPLLTDTLLATAVAEAVEARLPHKTLLTPTLWLGASGHHLRFPGTLSASFEAYGAALQSVVRSLIPHGFAKYFVLNAHGGNTEPNGVALRSLKAEFPNLFFAHTSYAALIRPLIAETLEGPLKEMRHACEAEASLMLHLRPESVRTDKLRDDGLHSEPPLSSVVHHFDEITEEGSYGYASRATAEKGRILFEGAVGAAAREIEALADGYVLRG
ncbi:MAG: creatininase family protein [Chthonomonadaceae bacterium]|nr:creatininase family protein [Chthonomonadaceae bacterium]